MSVKINCEFYNNHEKLEEPGRHECIVTLVAASCSKKISPGDNSTASKNHLMKLQDIEEEQKSDRSQTSVSDIMVALSIPTIRLEGGYYWNLRNHPYHLYVFGRTVDRLFEANPRPKVKISGNVLLTCNSASEPNKVLTKDSARIRGAEVYTSEEIHRRKWVSQNLKDYTKDRKGFFAIYDFQIWLCGFRGEHMSTFQMKVSGFELKAEIWKDEIFHTTEWLSQCMLRNKILSDFTIVSADRKEFPCHKVFLAVQSDVLGAMVTNEKMQEGKSSRVMFEDMSSAGVKAFLDYVYTFNLQAAKENPWISLELLQAGHKYGIESMENAIKKLFLKMPEAWKAHLDVDLLVRLFVFVRNVESLKALKEKVAAILVTMETGELMNCEVYLEIFRKKPDVAMDLCECFRVLAANK